MDQQTIRILFSLLRSAVYGTKLTEEEQNICSTETLNNLLTMASIHDIAHLVVLGLKQNELIPKENQDYDHYIFDAVYRCESIVFEYENICAALENAQIPFLPLKGSVLRKYYPEEWMRTSCDIDILVRPDDLDKTVSYLTENHNYQMISRGTHDVSLYSSIGIHLELHFDLLEEERTQNSINILRSVWSNVKLNQNSKYQYEMSDSFFYFYHIAHMAKHFKSGGCGIRPFLDLWILDRLENIDIVERDNLLSRGKLLKFANTSKKLSQAWFERGELDDVLIQMQTFILFGGVYGTINNRVSIQQTNKGGKFGYLLSRIFIPFTQLKNAYPILEKFPWLMPIMHIRRWFKLLQPNVMTNAKREISINSNTDKEKAEAMHVLLKKIGL